MRKVMKVFLIILVELFVVVGCFALGIHMSSQAEEKEPLTIRKIALVNLDDGIEINGTQKYYGTEFISELDDNFEITGLE